MLKLVQDATADAVGEGDLSTVDLDELCRLAAKEMLAVALLAERRAYLEAHADEVDAAGHRLVVGNGYARPRVVTTGAGAIEVRAPRIDDRREGCRFSSAILPAYMRKSPKVTEVLPILYLRGLSTGDFAPALGEFFGTEAGLSLPRRSVRASRSLLAVERQGEGKDRQPTAHSRRGRALPRVDRQRPPAQRPHRTDAPGGGQGLPS